jgi:hypothetical protein
MYGGTGDFLRKRLHVIVYVRLSPARGSWARRRVVIRSLDVDGVQEKEPSSLTCKSTPFIFRLHNSLYTASCQTTLKAPINSFSKNKPTRATSLPRHCPRAHPHRPGVAETSRDVRRVSWTLWPSRTRYDRRDIHTPFRGSGQETCLTWILAVSPQ